MKQRGAVEAIGLLLRDSRLRERFGVNRKAVLEEMAVEPEAMGCLLQLSLEQLGSQAKALIRKRRGAVAKLLPKTWQRLGRSAGQRFRDYLSCSEWPTSHDRHLIDAESFCCFLAAHREEAYSHGEHHWLRFLLSRRRFSVQLLLETECPTHQRVVLQYCFRRRLPFKKTISLFRVKSK